MCYTKQRNPCVFILRNSKKRYYENLNENSVVDNKMFWKNVNLSYLIKCPAKRRFI